LALRSLFVGATQLPPLRRPARGRWIAILTFAASDNEKDSVVPRFLPLTAKRLRLSLSFEITGGVVSLTWIAIGAVTVLTRSVIVIV
jgi:hypothetical protein